MSRWRRQLKRRHNRARARFNALCLGIGRTLAAALSQSSIPAAEWAARQWCAAHHAEYIKHSYRRGVLSVTGRMTGTIQGMTFTGVLDL